MQGDFSRFTFDPNRHYLRVLLQQGRVVLDADWNEQAAILLHQIRLLTRCIVGPHGGPVDGPVGFEIAVSEGGKNLSIGEGPYFVGGILCVSPGFDYQHQPDLPSPRRLPRGNHLVYLDVWERHLTYLEDGDVLEGSIREVALGGADTATRTRLVTQVRFHPAGSEREAKAWICALPSKSTGRMRARAGRRSPSNDPGSAAHARFTGAQNQLYRVEVHRSGLPKGVGRGKCATFKWSRDNGSIVFPIVGEGARTDAAALTLEHLGRDRWLGLEVGSWVEIVDDDAVLSTPTVRGEKVEPRPLLRVKTIDRDALVVTLDGSFSTPNAMGHPLLRRWEGPPRDIEGDTALPLEDGIEIEFSTRAGGAASHYRAGDYWLIPARPATGDIEWPRSRTRTGTVAMPIEAHGVEHAYAPLAWIDAKGKVKDLRRSYATLARNRTARS